VLGIATGRTQKLSYFRTIIRHFAQSRRGGALFRPASTLRSDAPGSQGHVYKLSVKILQPVESAISHQQSRLFAQVQYIYTYTYIYMYQPALASSHFYSRLATRLYQTRRADSRLFTTTLYIRAKADEENSSCTWF